MNTSQICRYSVHTVNVYKVQEMLSYRQIFVHI